MEIEAELQGSLRRHEVDEFTSSCWVQGDHRRRRTRLIDRFAFAKLKDCHAVRGRPGGEGRQFLAVHREAPGGLAEQCFEGDQGTDDQEHPTTGARVLDRAAQIHHGFKPPMPPVASAIAQSTKRCAGYTA